VPIFDKRAAQVLATVLLFVAIGAFAWGAHRILIAFLFAIFFAYLLEPLVVLAGRIRFAKGSRPRAILIVYLLLACVVSLFFYLLGPKLVHEGRGLAKQFPALLENVTSGQIAHQIGNMHGWSASTQERVQQFLANHQDTILGWAQAAGARAAELSTNAVFLLLIPILAVFFLRDGREFANSIVETLNRRSQRQLLRGILEDLDDMLASYIRAQLILAAISGVVYTAVLAGLRVPYAFVLGAIGGMLEFIPLAGPFIAAVLILGVSFLSAYSHLFWLIIFLGCWRLVQDYVNAPRIMGQRVELHPLAALFAVLVGGEIAGVIGVYLSIPIMATLRILWKRYQRYEESQVNARVPTETHIST
jgi:predicted PurR-regulated permease PerM